MNRLLLQERTCSKRIARAAAAAFFSLGLSIDGAQSESVSSEAYLTVSPPPEADSLFSELDPAVTGMADFKNEFGSPRIWGDHWRTYLFGAIGTGVAIGDVDGDGLADVFAVSKNERSRLYRNLGDFRFQDVTDQSGIDESGPYGMDKNDTPGGGAAFADVNNDGRLDLYLCFLGAPNQLWINDGAGSFTEQAAHWGVAADTASVMGYFADYDRDGLLDLYLATNLLQEGDAYPGPKPDLLFRNTGDRFEEVTGPAGIAGEGHAHSAVWWDYNDDGWPDIYVANDFAEPDRLYRNNGDGTFEDVIEEVSPRAPYYAMGSDFGDVNGDGLDDFWVADMAPTSRSRYKSTLESHNHVYEGVLRGFPNQYMQNALLLNLNGQRFTDVAALAGLHRTDWTWAARLEDLDSDGDLDAFATNGMLRSFNDGDLGMRLKGRNSLRYYAQIFRPTPVLNERNLAFSNTGDLRFEEFGADWGLDKLGVSFGAAFADLNHDGALDLVLSNFREPPSVYRGMAGRASTLRIGLRGTESNRFGIGAKVQVVTGSLTQSKTLLPHRGYMSSDEPVLHFGLGSETGPSSVTIRWPSGKVQALSELDANRRYVVEENGAIPPKEAEKGKARFERVDAQFPPEADLALPDSDEFLRQPLLPFARSRFVGSAVAGDLNGDGRSDLVLGGYSGAAAKVLLAEAGFSFRFEWSLDLDEDFPSADTALALGDFNGDGTADLLALSGGSSLQADDLGYQDRLYLGNGDGTFVRDFDSALSVVAGDSQSVAISDFDQDGTLDVFIGGGSVPGRYPKRVRSSLWRGGLSGEFTRVGEAVTGLAEVGRVAVAAWADFANDGYPELIALPEWGEPLFFTNEGGELRETEDWSDETDLSGLWTSMAIGDFDGDGRLDIAAGNLGLNTGGIWDPEAGPRRLWWKEEGGMQIVDTIAEYGEEWPVAWRDRVVKAHPGHAVSSKSYSEYGEGRVASLYGELAAQGFSVLELNESRSGIFWQQPDGSFVFEAFPRFAQAGRVTALLAADFDGDGCSDIVAGIEPPSLAPWTGRDEWGALVYIRGDRDRMLHCELPEMTGLDIGPNSPRELLWADFDGDELPELCVVPVRGRPQLYELRR